MLSWIARRARRRRNAHDLYGSIVALSRSPVLYAELGVPDSVEGRFEILTFHLFTCLDRIAQFSGANIYLAQDLVDVFSAFRGPGPAPAGRRERPRFSTVVSHLPTEPATPGLAPPMCRGGPGISSQRALRNGSLLRRAAGEKSGNALAAALAGNIFSPADAPAKARCLANYVRGLQKSLSGTEISELEAGRISAPEASISGNRNA